METLIRILVTRSLVLPLSMPKYHGWAICPLENTCGFIFLLVFFPPSLGEVSVSPAFWMLWASHFCFTCLGRIFNEFPSPAFYSFYTSLHSDINWKVDCSPVDFAEPLVGFGLFFPKRVLRYFLSTIERIFFFFPPLVNHQTKLRELWKKRLQVVTEMHCGHPIKLSHAKPRPGCLHWAHADLIYMDRLFAGTPVLAQRGHRSSSSLGMGLSYCSKLAFWFALLIALPIQTGTARVSSSLSTTHHVHHFHNKHGTVPIAINRMPFLTRGGHGKPSWLVCCLCIRWFFFGGGGVVWGFSSWGWEGLSDGSGKGELDVRWLLVSSSGVQKCPCVGGGAVGKSVCSGKLDLKQRQCNIAMPLWTFCGGAFALSLHEGTFVTLHNTQMVKRLLSETLAAIFRACSSFILLFVSFQRWWEAKGTTRIRYVKFHLFLRFLEPFQWQQFFIVFQSSDKMWTGNLFCPISKWMMCSAEDGKILTYPQQSPSN